MTARKVHTVRCIDCGFLSKRVRQMGHVRGHSGFFELEPSERANLRESFGFVPADSNALQPGEYGCYRHKADFPAEIGELVGKTATTRENAAHEVLHRERHCGSWCQYEAGIDPAGHLQEVKAKALEDDRRAFEKTLRNFQDDLAKRESKVNRRMAWLALAVTLGIGIVQLWTSAMATTPDALGARFVRWMIALTDYVGRLFGR